MRPWSALRPWPSEDEAAKLRRRAEHFRQLTPDRMLMATVEQDGEVDAEPAMIVEVGPGSVTFVEYDGRRVTYDATELRAAIGEAA